MLIRKVTSLALASMMLANCVTKPDGETFCGRNTAICVVGGVFGALIM